MVGKAIENAALGAMLAVCAVLFSCAAGKLVQWFIFVFLSAAEAEPVTVWWLVVMIVAGAMGGVIATFVNSKAPPRGES